VHYKSKYFNHMEQNRKKGTPLPRLCLISSGEEQPDSSSLLLKQLNLLPRSLPCIVQIREKKLEAKQRLILALNVRATRLPEGTLLLMNERADLALAAGLDGVHLPENACSVKTLRTFAPELIYGCSIHSASALRIAEKSGADYLLFGPVFDTPSKRRYGAPQGLEKLEALCQATTLPVFAIGGITPQNAARCIAKGAYGIAGLSIFQDINRFAETIEQFYLHLQP
jgi:thiamine-phosphate pyrophosphorylase